MKRKIGIVGLGDIAQKAYLPVLGQSERVDIVGIMSRTKSTVEAVGERHRIENRFTELESLLNQKPDLMFVHTPTTTHEEIVIACLLHGIDVYVDKPLSYDIDASNRMMNTAKQHGRLLAVGFNRRFAPMYVEAKRWVEEAGGFDLCIAQKHRTRQQQMSAKHTLYDDLIHMIDLLLWLGAKPHQIASYVESQDDTGKLMHATGSLLFEQSTALFSMNRRAGADLEKVELHGGGRSVEITNLESAVWHDRLIGQQVQRFSSWDSISYRRGFHGIIDHVLDSIDDPEQSTIRADQVLASHELIETLCTWNNRIQ